MAIDKFPEGRECDVCRRVIRQPMAILEFGEFNEQRIAICRECVAEAYERLDDEDCSDGLSE